MNIVLDTNALMMPVECDVRLFDELERLFGTVRAVVPAPVETELRGLADSGGDQRRAARVGIDLLERCELRETTERYADDAVLELARESGVPAVTNDRPLRERLLEAGVLVVCLHEANKLDIIHP